MDSPRSTTRLALGLCLATIALIAVVAVAGRTPGTVNGDQGNAPLGNVGSDSARDQPSDTATAVTSTHAPSATRTPVSAPTDSENAAVIPSNEAACENAGCDDGDHCTVDICSPITGCVHTPISCSDASCIVDVCAGGICVLYDASGCTGSP